MVKELSAMDLHYLIKELKELENSKVDRIYHTKEDPKELLIILHVTGKGKHILRFILPSLAYIEYSKESQGTATGLCMMLRKYLEGGILRKIIQPGFERIIELEFFAKGECYFLVIELFSKGNIIFLGKDRKILNILEEQEWKDRKLKRGQAYEKPISTDIREITQERLQELIDNSKKDSIVKTLAIELGLGGTYAEELCSITGIGKQEKKADAAKILPALKGMLDKGIKANSSKGKAFPFELETIRPEKYHDSFNQAIAENTETKDKEQEYFESQKSRILKIIEEQEISLLEVQKEFEEDQKRAQAIYENYKELDSIITILRDVRKKHGWKEVKKRISQDEKFSKIIKDINEENNIVRIDLEQLK